MVGKQVHHSLKPVAYREPIAWPRLLITMALCSIVTGALLVAVEPRHPVAESTLGLKVTSQQGDVEIRWNHEAPAEKGLVKIQDGEFAQSISLDQRDLQDGHISYRAITGDVRIYFEVIAPDGNSISESARVVGAHRKN